MDSLLVLTECRSALSEAKTLDDVLAIRDKAEATRQLLKVRKESLASQNEAAEIKILAERKLGESLAKMEKAKNHKSTSLTMRELEIDHNAAHRWQYIAKVPDRQFAAMVRDANEQGEELTSAAVYRAGRKIIAQDRPPKAGKSEWNTGDWIAYMRKQVSKAFEDCPQEFRSVLPDVLRELADEFSEDCDGSGRGTREATAGAA